MSKCASVHPSEPNGKNMDTTNPKRARLNIDCSIVERKMIRILAAKEDKNISQYVLGLIRRECTKNGVPELLELEQSLN